MSLLEFYGKECGHCRRMESLVAELEKKEKLIIDKFEVWHDQANAARMGEYDRGRCGGVPFFYNTATGEHICGEASYEELKRWALGK